MQPDKHSVMSSTFGRLYDEQLRMRQARDFDKATFEATVEKVIRARALQPNDIGPRQARHLIAETQVALGIVDASIRSLRRLGMSVRSQEALMHQLDRKLAYLHYCASYRIESRAAPPFKARPDQHLRSKWHVYLDEAGTRSPNPQPDFHVFAVAAAVIERKHYLDVVEPEILALKQRFWGERASDVVLHEPDIRNHEGEFSFGGDVNRQREFDEAYAECLQKIEFFAVAAVLDKVRIRDVYGLAPVDQFLPRTLYAMAYDFVLERVCNLLYFECDDGHGAVFPESIGTREDAELQFEHARVFMEGTRYVPEKWFQYQLYPGLQFFRKRESVGIELADTVARTVADHANGLGSTAVRWDSLEGKLYAGHMDRPQRWGSYKLFPPTR